MAATHKDRRRPRFSFLDILTVLVLAMAVYLFVRPGSATHAAVTQWLDRRSTERAIEEHWDRLAAVAAPLYADGGEPDIIEFSDYECPFCRQANPIVDSAMAAGARIALVHLPILSHANARPAALAAICAEQVGRFHDAHRFFMTTDAWQTDTAWSRLPGFAVIHDTPGFRACLLSAEAAARLARHDSLTTTLRIRATPTFVSREAILRERPTAANLRALAVRAR